MKLTGRHTAPGVSLALGARVCVHNEKKREKREKLAIVKHGFFLDPALLSVLF